MAGSEENAVGVLDKILRYVDSPFKLLAAILMGAAAFAGYLLFQNQTFLLDVIREQRKLPTINEARVDDAAALLLRSTGANVVAVFKVNPLVGTRVLYRAFTKEGRGKDVEGIDVGLFTANVANNSDVVALMSGAIPCGAYTRPQSELGLWYIAQGVSFTCRISVPPDRSRFIGQITVGWATQPPDMDTARELMTIAATMLTQKGY